MHLIPSLWARLQDDQPSVTREVIQSKGVEGLRDEILSDLTHMFNTRQEVWEALSTRSVLASSLLTYGLPDITTLNPNSTAAFQDLCFAMEQAILRFEPRLKEARVYLVEQEKKNSRSLTFRIEATLLIDPHPAPIIMDTKFLTDIHEFQ